MPVQVVLYCPEIPPNTGNIARLCAAMDIDLHLVEPLGFSLEDRYLKRAGLDYWPKVRLRIWPDWNAFLANRPTGRLVASSSRRGLDCRTFSFQADDLLLFGPETSGLPEHVLENSAVAIRIPISSNVRSLNLSTAAGIILYEALCQTKGREFRDKSC